MLGYTVLDESDIFISQKHQWSKINGLSWTLMGCSPLFMLSVSQPSTIQCFLCISLSWYLNFNAFVLLLCHWDAKENLVQYFDIWKDQEETLNLLFFCRFHYMASSSAPASVCGLLRTWLRSSFTSPTEFTGTRWWRTKFSPSLTSYSEKVLRAERVSLQWREREPVLIKAKPVSPATWGGGMVFTVFLHSLPPP